MEGLDPQLLRVLRTVRDTGSISRAAAALGYSQPAVSQLLARAERRLGHDLVLRGARGVTLTESGRVLAEHALSVEAALAAAREDLEAVGGLARGRVRIAGFPSASSTLVPPVLATLAADSPGVVTSYVEAEPPEALDLLRRGEVDVAITFSHAPQDDDVLADPTLTARVLGRDPLALVTPASATSSTSSTSATSAASAASAASVVSAATVDERGDDVVADLAAQRDARWIGGCPRCRGHLLASCAASGFTPEIVLETDNAAAVVGLVAAGLGVALLPRLALTTTIVPPGVTVTPARDELARRVEVVVARGAERVPSVGAALTAVGAAAHLLG
ncbi:LysR substrate-binding domain-containing protein [Curtobacterium sp. 458]|uniref:LysR family transcriptional regulator n=1 Tax=Curtobacterium sp. 458 TaxID=3050069 RepID=UPI0025B3354D|nr:LysR substrate-binding domain-containing protein [Curtobacterium sp. 458]WJX99687.1 LysR substrate-binding domain-containing protein [Curtobacterium sp. 458]